MSLNLFIFDNKIFVLFYNKFTFNDHIASIPAKALKSYGFILRNCKELHRNKPLLVPYVNIGVQNWQQEEEFTFTMTEILIDLAFSNAFKHSTGSSNSEVWVLEEIRCLFRPFDHLRRCLKWKTSSHNPRIKVKLNFS